MNHQLTDDERSRLTRLAEKDGLLVDDYYLRRGEKSGHAFAFNGFSMAYDLTDGSDVDADSIDEADDIVATRGE